jgi:hypothetical protein
VNNIYLFLTPCGFDLILEVKKFRTNTEFGFILFNVPNFFTKFKPNQI